MKVEELIDTKPENITDLDVIVVDSGDKTPYVELNKAEGLLKFEGRSIPENAQQFYKGILGWVEKYMRKPAKLTTLHLNLEYFNTSSSKIILDVMMRLEKLKEKGHDTKVVWFYHKEDEEMYEAGDDYASLIQVPFEIISYE